MVERRRLRAAEDGRYERAARFSTRLGDALHALKITHKALAQQLGVTHHTVDSWTRGGDATLPGDENLERLCALLERRTPGLGRELAGIAGHPWSPPPALHLVESAAPASNLPAPVSSFIGRTHELAAVKRLLGGAPAGPRLLTLLGAGGIGKTRLALQVAASCHAAFPHGVYLVELAALADPALLPQAVAMVLGVREQPGQPLLDTVAGMLRSRHLLLVLDNCEHLVAACATLAARLLQAAPRLTILTTSREALHIAGETVWRVPPLSLPAAGVAPAPEDLARYEAVQLLLERARASLPEFAITPDNSTAISQICRRLDGVPLALELAAACVRVLTVEQIAVRLDDRFHLLTDGSRDALPRHQTLQATVAWSYELLAEPERVLFAHLAVFAGGCTLEAAEAICAGAGLASGQILGLLKRLVDQSLIVVDAGDRAARYRMLETIRAYALEQLAARNDEAPVRQRHAVYYLALAEMADTHLRGPQQPQWLDRLEREHDNLRAALRWALDTGDYPLALRFGRALTLFWFFHGHFSEGRRWLETMLRVDQPDLDPLRAWALNGAGVLACFQGDFLYAGTLFEESIGLAERQGDLESVAFSLASLSGTALYQNDLTRATALAEDSLARFRTYDNPWNTGLAITNLIPALLAQGRLDEAMRFAEERLALYRALGNPWGIATSYTHLGLVAAAQGACAQAEAFYREGISHFLALGDKWGSYECLAGLAGAVAAQDRPEQAARLLGATDALREALGAIAPPAYYEHDRVIASVRAELGEAAWEAAWAMGRALPLQEAIADRTEQQPAPTC